jgi:hypothetical protein
MQLRAAAGGGPLTRTWRTSAGGAPGGMAGGVRQPAPSAPPSTRVGRPGTTCTGTRAPCRKMTCAEMRCSWPSSCGSGASCTAAAARAAGEVSVSAVAPVTAEATTGAARRRPADAAWNRPYISSGARAGSGGADGGAGVKELQMEG